MGGVHICYMRKDKGTKKTTAWECSGRRRLGCEFKIRTTNSEGPGALSIITMSDPESHTCSADKVAPLMQKFRLKLATRMTEDLDVGWSKIWRSEAAFLEVSKTNLSSINKLSLRWVMLNPFEVRRKGQEQSGLLRFQRNTRKWTANDHEENIQKLEV